MTNFLITTREIQLGGPGPFSQALLPGTPGTVELGLPIDTANKNPCAITPPATSLIDSTGTLTNTACNAYFDYNRSNRTRTSAPTERLGYGGAYFQRLEFTASYAYSSAEMDAPLNEFSMDSSSAQASAKKPSRAQARRSASRM